MAMKPDWRPMRRTRPTPFEALLASTLAASSACCASSTAVSKPKHLSICACAHTRPAFSGRASSQSTPGKLEEGTPLMVSVWWMLLDYTTTPNYNATFSTMDQSWRS